MYKTLMIGVLLLIGIVAARQYPYDTALKAHAQVPIPEIEKIYEYEHVLLAIAPKEVEPEPKMFYVDPQERECLAKAIYWEARNQSLDGKVAVGYVVMNRVNSGMWRDTVCKVVFQGCQFSWVCGDKAKKNLNALQNANEKFAWAESLALANELLSEYNDIEDVTYGATFFHAHYVKPKWSRWKKIERTVRIDDHIFYRFRKI